MSLLRRIKNDTQFRIKLFLCLTFAFNLAYSIFMFVVSKVNSSDWFFVMSIYYGLLSAARIFVFRQIQARKGEIFKLNTLRACGCFLLIINLAVSVMMFLIIRRNQYVIYHQITVIAMATYTFTALTVAIITGIKYVKKHEHVYSCVKIISLICASVSIVTLTNTMLAVFGQDNELLRRIILPILCAVVSVFIIVSAIFMICKANLYIRILKNEKERE